MDLAPSQPADAGAHAAKLAQGLADKMLDAGDLCIRLLTEAAGDKASAHALNVTLISMLMGRTFGPAEPDMLDLGTGALLHDVGKLELPDRVRHREDHFSAAEQRLYEEHVAFGIAAARAAWGSAPAPRWWWRSTTSMPTAAASRSSSTPTGCRRWRASSRWSTATTTSAIRTSSPRR
ncbi:HD domain-containing protein [Piscinibacter aquaticus]|uniref:HD domain-containing protein n=1 Tax=Piscinibacter aquaticus TaxID=392597 RepID=A0A5C6U1M2_9BURK|nr:HD domain-containing protein [Piscinibacter aquaticus]